MRVQVAFGRLTRGHASRWFVCARCFGSGRLGRWHCNICDGTGSAPMGRAYTYEVPPPILAFLDGNGYRLAPGSVLLVDTDDRGPQEVTVVALTSDYAGECKPILQVVTL